MNHHQNRVRETANAPAQAVGVLSSTPSTKETQPLFYPLGGHYAIGGGEVVSVPWQYSDDLTPFEASGYVKIENSGPHQLSMAVDDNGFIEIGGTRVLELTGSHASTTVETTVELEAGYHYAVVHSENLPVPDELAGYPNARQFEPKVDGHPMVLFTVEPVEQELYFIPARGLLKAKLQDDESGAFNYIPSGSTLRNGRHEIHAGLQYRGSLRDSNFDGTIVGSRGEKDRFDPASVARDANGEAQFELISTDTSSKPAVAVNGVNAQSGGLLPAVFQDKFKITIYYTPLESGFTHFSETIAIECRFDGSHEKTNIVVVAKFWDTVSNPKYGEGFGKLSNPPKLIKNGIEISYPYLSYERVLYTHPMGNSQNVLQDKISCAGSASQFNLQSSKVKILLNEEYAHAFKTEEFLIDDVGSAVGKNHLDLYWGEDNPKNGGNNASVPAGLPNGSPDEEVQVLLIKL